MATYSEFARSFSAKIANRPRAVRRCEPGRADAPCRDEGAFDMQAFRLCRGSLGRRADDALEQIVHLVEEGIEVVVGLVDDDLAGLVVLQRTDIDRLLSFSPSIAAIAAVLPAPVAPAPNGVFCTKSTS